MSKYQQCILDYDGLKQITENLNWKLESLSTGQGKIKHKKKKKERSDDDEAISTTLFSRKATTCS